MLNKTVVWHTHKVSKKNRADLKGQKPCILWFTGLSGSGKSTLANSLEFKLNELGYHTYLLDGDNLRHGLNNDLGFDKEARSENIRRVAEVAKLFVDSGLIVLSAFISPFIKDREFARNLVNRDEFIEIFVDTSFEVCENRDIKGLYKKARCGEIEHFTGIDSPYERPLEPEIVLKNDKYEIEKNRDMILNYLRENGYINVK